MLLLQSFGTLLRVDQSPSLWLAYFQNREMTDRADEVESFSGHGFMEMKTEAEVGRKAAYLAVEIYAPGM